MSLDSCTPCACIAPNETNQFWKQEIRVTLCQILAAIEGGSLLNNAVILPQVTKLFGVVPVAYTTTSFLGAPHSIRTGAINNQTDVDIDISLDGGVTTWVTIPAYTYFPIDFGDKTFVGSADMFYKYHIGAPSLGSVVFQGNY